MLHGAMTLPDAVMKTVRPLESHLISAGLDYPGWVLNTLTRLILVA